MKPDISERLREYQGADMREAAVEVKSLRKEVAFLHERRGQLVIERDRYAAALGEYPEGRDVILSGALAECEALRKDAERLRRIVWEQVYQVHLVDRMDFYPCLICGYNGPGFWQSAIHKCAAMGESHDE